MHTAESVLVKQQSTAGRSRPISSYGRRGSSGSVERQAIIALQQHQAAATPAVAQLSPVEQKNIVSEFVFNQHCRSTAKNLLTVGDGDSNNNIHRPHSLVRRIKSESLSPKNSNQLREQYGLRNRHKGDENLTASDLDHLIQSLPDKFLRVHVTHRNLPHIDQNHRPRLRTISTGTTNISENHSQEDLLSTNSSTVTMPVLCEDSQPTGRPRSGSLPSNSLTQSSAAIILESPVKLIAKDPHHQHKLAMMRKRLEPLPNRPNEHTLV